MQVMQGFIIHLQRAAARRAHAEELARLLPREGSFSNVTILPAVDARALSAQETGAVYKRKLFAPRYPFRLQPAEIACFLSHRRAWQALLASRADCAFITEDDMQPLAGFAAGLALAERHIKACGLIRFPHNAREKGAELAQSGGARLIRPQPAGLGAVAYLLSRDAAAKLLAFTAQFDRPLDVALQMFWLSGVRPAAIIPGGIAEISARLGGSTLAQRRDLGQKLRHELLRPLYRGQIRLLSRLKG